MISFIDEPNLPKGKVRTIICGEYCEKLCDFLKSINIEMIKVVPNLNIDKATATHADMLAIHLGENVVLVDESQTELAKALTEIEVYVDFTDTPVKGDYPDDIRLNFAIMGKRIFGNINYCDKKILKWLNDYEFYNCKQGYCKCSCLVIDENTLITDDKSICNVAVANGVDCLLISKGDIALSGHEYGFIGGASGKISQDEILFFGDITKHQDYKKIADFITKHGCKIISLDFTLTDFGGMIPLREET